MANNDVWSDDRVSRWLRNAAGLDRQLAPVSDVLFAAAALRPGERVLDVGCGTATTTRRAARDVGPTGRCTGLDIAADMLRAAAEPRPDPDAAPLDWIEADVVTWDPPRAAYDVVISRFGVMFFADPAAAFANLATAVRPGGRLAVAVWARRDDSPVFAVTLHAAVAAMARRGLTADVPPDDDGPFSLHDADALTALLTDAGWASVDITTHTLLLPFAGGQDPATSAVSSLDFGPTRLVTVDLDSTARAAVATDIAAALTGHVDADGHVQLDATIRVVTATKP